MNILFVCGGNIGRSQMAEAIFKSLTNDTHHVRSAGIEVGEFDGQLVKDRDSSRDVLIVMKEKGFDISERTRTQLTSKLAEDAELIISMVEPDREPLLQQQGGKVVYWEVVDPFGTSLEFTRTTYQQIFSLVESLITDLRDK